MHTFPQYYKPTQKKTHLTIGDPFDCCGTSGTCGTSKPSNGEEKREMAAVKMFSGQQMLSAPFKYFLSIKSCREVCLKKNYSVYPSHYVKPVYKKEQQAALEGTEEGEKLLHRPIKAAKNDQTSSAFHDELTRKIANYIMKGGQKVLARNLLEKAMENIKRAQLERYHKALPEQKSEIEIDPKIVLRKAIENCKPILELTPIKRGGVTYQVPVPVSDKHGQWLAIKWLLNAAKDRERTIHFPEKFAWELLDASNNQGRVVKQKQDLHKQCEANRAYAHYRWS